MQVGALPQAEVDLLQGSGKAIRCYGWCRAHNDDESTDGFYPSCF